MVLQTKSAVVISVLLCFIGMISCGRESVISTVSLEDAMVLPSIHGENIYSLISDSGITRYALKTKVWDMYSNDVEPYWFFPEGIYLEKFDSLFHVEGYIQADTAYFFEKKELWQLKGNVHCQNLLGDKFDTSELFWNQKEPAHSINSIYTDSITRIDTGDRVIISRGFKSNQPMTDYRFYDNSVEIIVNEEELVQPNDSVQHPEIKR